MKTCTQCGVAKPRGDFPPSPSATDGLRSYCKSCNAARASAWYRDNPERAAAYHRARRLRRYGLTPEGYDAMLVHQGECCAICRASEPGGRGSWHVDHDHSCCPGPQTCGKCVRGLLCNRCNIDVLPVLEDAAVLARAIAYLEEPPAKKLWGDATPRQPVS